MRYHLTTEHTSNNYGNPLLVDDDGKAYGPDELLPSGDLSADYVVEHMQDDPLMPSFIAAFRG